VLGLPRAGFFGFGYTTQVSLHYSRARCGCVCAVMSPTLILLGVGMLSEAVVLRLFWRRYRWVYSVAHIELIKGV